MPQIKGQTLILASNSPRRKELLKTLNFQFEVERFDFNEVVPKTIQPEHAAEFIARSKLDQIPKQIGKLYLTSDTTVIFKDGILGKPKSINEAKEMLQRLSGNVHKVISGVAIGNLEETLYSFSDTTNVYFNKLTENEIEYYVNTYSPLDKAGAYGIQDWIGYIGITNIKGTYNNVMGLPTHLLYKELMNL